MATGFTMLTDAYDLRRSTSSLIGELWCIGLQEPIWINGSLHSIRGEG